MCRRLSPTAGHCECVDVAVALILFAVIHSPAQHASPVQGGSKRPRDYFPFLTDLNETVALHCAGKSKGCTAELHQCVNQQLILQ